jgi:stage V sporulation protein S
MLRVSASSNPSSSAGAIANGIRETGEAVLQVIGPRAVNQAVKAVAIARGYVAASGLDLYFVPDFASVRIGDEERTAMQFTVRPRHRLASADADPSPPAGPAADSLFP